MKTITLLAALSSAICPFAGVTARAITEVNWTSRNLKAKEPLPFAFVFDIDGVLLQGVHPIPNALANETIAWLRDNDVPFVLLTNGGGKTEEARVEDLNRKLGPGARLTTDMFIQSHTPFKELVGEPENLGDKTVLVTGSDYEGSRAIMKNYGYKSVVTPGDIWKAHPLVFPFVKESEKPNYDHLPDLPKPIFEKASYGPDTNLSEFLKIDAMFILNDVRDWALDYQIFSDLLLSHQGYYGTYSQKNAVGQWQQDNQTKLYFSNADLVWGSAYHLPRYGQGSTKASLEGLWRAHTGGADLISYTYGKPTEFAYRFAEKRLRSVRDNLLENYRRQEIPPLRRVYMIGDNPESDIVGPNTYKSENGTEWFGLLVRTGVYDETRSKLEGATAPLEILENVNQAVRWALEREGVLPKSTTTA